MNPTDPFESHDAAPLESDETIHVAASAWVVRHDRGLSEAESNEFERWLRADPRHAAAWKAAGRTWGFLDDEDLSALPAPAATGRSVWPGWVAAGLAAAAAVVLSYVAWSPAESAAPGKAPVVATAQTEEARILRLSDGTTVFLKGGSEVIERFTPSERRVLLVSGEAHFDVAKNQAWPFIVRAGSVEVRAVGTAFNVTMQTRAVEVRVTEGRVQVTPDEPASASPATVAAPTPLVEAGQRAVVEVRPQARAVVQVATMNPEELAHTLAWHNPLLRLAGRTLEEVVEEFQRTTGRRVVLADPELKNLMLGGKYRPDNLDGLAKFLAQAYGLTAERTPDDGLILHKAP